jgi:hypothetical protein
MSDPTSSAGMPEPDPTGPITPAPTPDVAAQPVVAASAMAPTGGRVVGKTRNPWGVWGLSVITLGIYFLYWYYKVNSEVRDYDRSIEVEPGISVVAQFIPIGNTGGRINRTQESGGSSVRCSPLAGLLLMFVFSTGVVYYQSQVNKVWDLHGNPEPGTAV